MKRKKVVLVIVEGPSDEMALGAVMQRLYNEDEILVMPMHGDVTSDKRTTTSNIISRIGDVVHKCMTSPITLMRKKKTIHSSLRKNTGITPGGS